MGRHCPGYSVGLEAEIVPGVWDNQANTWLSKTLEIGYTLERLRDDVDQGRAFLFKVNLNDEPKAVIILSPAGDTLEIWGFAGEVGGLPGIRCTLAAVELIAWALGLSSVWLKTARRGLVSWVVACGYHIEKPGKITSLKKCIY